MVHYEYRHLEASQDWSRIDQYVLGRPLDPDLTRAQIIAGFDSFLQAMPPVFRTLGVEHRLIRDTQANAFESLLDAVFGWMRTPGFVAACPTYESFLLTVIAILEPSLHRIARDRDFVHPALGRDVYEQMINPTHAAE